MSYGSAIRKTEFQIILDEEILKKDKEVDEIKKSYEDLGHQPTAGEILEVLQFVHDLKSGADSIY